MQEPEGSSRSARSQGDLALEKEYEKVFSQLGSVQTVFPSEVRQKLADMAEQTLESNQRYAAIESIDKFPNNPGRNIATKGGEVAEEWHRESYNLDAIARGKGSRAITDNDSQAWSESGFQTNDPVVDIAVSRDGEISHTAQVKYYKDAQHTATELRRLEPDGSAKYAEADSYLGPSDQVFPANGHASIQEEAHRAAIRNMESRPEVSQAALGVEDKITSTLSADGISSTPLSKADANVLASDAQAEVRLQMHDDIYDLATATSTANAAVGAAAVSAIASGAFNVVRYCKMVTDGQLTQTEAVKKIAGEVTASGADAAIKASANVGLQSVMARYSSEEVLRQTAQNGLATMMQTTAATVAVVSGIEAIKDLVRLSSGQIDKRQFEERTTKNVLRTSISVTGASVGANIATLLPMSFPPLLGGIAGALIAGQAYAFAVENHIEKPYRELMENTSALKDVLNLLQEVTNNICKSQIVFTAFLAKDAELDAGFQKQHDRIENSGRRMSRAIDDL